MLVLMADIFPTGYFAVSRFLKDLNSRDRGEFTAVVIGCGSVGICAVTCALFTMIKTVYAIDSVPERLAEAAKIGAIPVNLNDSPVKKIRAATGGCGTDVVMEVVGHADAFMLAFDMVDQAFWEDQLRRRTPRRASSQRVHALRQKKCDHGLWEVPCAEHFRGGAGAARRGAEQGELPV